MPDKSADSDKARKLLDIYRGEVDDFFKLWPPDKDYYFSSDDKAFLAYGVRHKVAVCLGDPVGADASIESLMADFKAYCAGRGWTIALIQATDKYAAAYARNGLRNVLIGADAVIDLDRFTQTTIHNKYFRNIVNRFEKNAAKVSSHQPPHDPKLLKDLKAVSDSWLELPHRKEWSFLTGRFDSDYLRQVPLHVLRDRDGQALAFVNELPSFKPGVATIDLMRHRADASPNSIDYLFIRLLQIKRQEGYSGFNLGMSPLDGRPFATNRTARLLIHFYRLSNRFIGFKGLHQFKAKYQPQWEPRYVWYQGGPRRLPRIGLAVAALLKASKSPF